AASRTGTTTGLSWHLLYGASGRPGPPPRNGPAPHPTRNGAMWPDTATTGTRRPVIQGMESPDTEFRLYYPGGHAETRPTEAARGGTREEPAGLGVAHHDHGVVVGVPVDDASAVAAPE